MEIDKAWLDSHEWMLRSSNNGISHAGYRWKREGEWNKAPDWNDRVECGSGFHGIAPEAHGYRFDYSCIELHETRGKRVIINKNKIKVPESRIVAVGSEISPEAFERCGIRVIRDGDKIDCIDDGIWIVLHGSATIENVSGGGAVFSYNDSKITIATVAEGGEVRFYGGSEMAIETVSGGGTVLSYNDSKITIENVAKGGEAYAHDNSKMTIATVADGGEIYSYGDSKTTIETVAKGGYACALWRQ